MTEEELLAGIGEMDAGGGGLDLSALMPALPQRTPPTPPWPQVPSGRQQVLGSVLAALPMILRGGNGGPVEAAAFMQGMQQARLQKQQQVNQGYVQDRQAFQDQRALDVDAQTQAYRTAQLSAAQQRAEASRQDALVKEFAAALDRAESPEAIDALTSFYGARVPQMSERLNTFAEPFKAPSRVNRKRAEKQIATLEKTYGQDWALKLGNATHVLPGAETDPATGKPRGISTQELLAMAGTNVQGLPQKPANPRPPAALGSFEDYVQRKYGDDPTADQIEAARKSYGQADDRPPSPGRSGLFGDGGAQADVDAIADAIVRGEQPPTTTGLYGKTAAVRSALAKRGYNLTNAALDYDATRRHFQTLNGPQQTRIRQAADTALHSLDVIDELARQWQGGRFPILNRGRMAAAKAGALGVEAQKIATQLDAQITDVTSELANVYMGGNSPTDHALSLASKNLNAAWSLPQLRSALDLARTNITIRQNAIRNVGVIGPTPSAPAAAPIAPKPNPFRGGR
ncbi:MAG: hypothetical protein AB7P99_10170 [Vicinamibacterales bacterium]